MSKIKMVCAICGSEDVTVSFTCSWDVTTQTWTVHEMQDDAYCASCDGPTNVKEEQMKLINC